MINVRYRHVVQIFGNEGSLYITWTGNVYVRLASIDLSIVSETEQPIQLFFSAS